MIRRTVLATTALLVIGGAATTALAQQPRATNSVCVATSAGGNSPRDGYCVWFTLPVSQQ